VDNHRTAPVHFKASDDLPDPDRVLHALAAVCGTLDQADITSAKGDEANRISYLISAAAILSLQLADRITDAPVRMEVVNG
jgi:hypothetical protein